MAYRRKGLSEVERKVTRVKADFGGHERMQFKITSLPMAVGSHILDSIHFNKLVDESVKWDPSQCIVSPGDAAKALVLTMLMSGYRPSIENVALKFRGHPLTIYFDSVTDHRQFDPDMLARTLTRIHECNDTQLFMSVSQALRAHYGLTTRAVHSDTTSVSVEGNYDRYDSDENAIIRDSEGNLVKDDQTIHITRGYSKDNRPDLKQYMIGEVVDENGASVLSKPLDGNTADCKWNEMCLDLLKETLRDGKIAYVADSKVINDPLVTKMISDKIRFISRCPANFNDKTLSKSLMDFDLNELREIPNLSKRKDAAKRRIVEGTAVFNGTKLRTVLVETSTLAGRAEKAIGRQKELVETKIASFDNVFKCKGDAVAKFEKLKKKLSKTVFELECDYEHRIVETRPKGRPRADGTDIRRADEWVARVKYQLNKTKAEELRRREGYIMLISNIPDPDEDPDNGMTAEELVGLYGKEWKVEAAFHTKKRPILVERLFLKDPGRAQALITVVNIACLLRGIIQILLRKGLSQIPDENLPRCGRGTGVLQRNVTTDFFVDSCSNCYIQYDGATNKYVIFGEEGKDERATAFLGLLGIPPEKLFSFD